MGIIAGRVIQSRERRGWTQGQLATYAKINQSHLSRIESGKYVNVGSEYLSSLALALKTSVDYLVGHTDDPRPLAVAQSSQSHQLQVEVGSLLADEKAAEVFGLLLTMPQKLREEVYDYIRYLAQKEKR